MADTCATCGTKLGLARRLTGATECADCAAKSKAEREAAAAEYEALATRAGNLSTDLATIHSALPALAERAGFDQKRTRDMNWRALLATFDRVLADEVITEPEEDRLTQLADALGFTQDDFNQALEQYRAPFYIARANDGRLPEFEPSRIMAKRGEVAHLETEAALVKEVQIKEWRGGSRGVSFRIARGVSYRVGATRGQMHVAGTQLQEQDRGQLVVTSLRTVFAGTRRTVEVSYPKLISLNIFTDAVQFHVSNRQTPSLFRVSSGPMVAAAVNGAIQRLGL